MPNRREFIGSAVAATLIPNISLSQTRRRPNILFILADDLGYGDLSCYGRPDYQPLISIDLHRKEFVSLTPTQHRHFAPRLVVRSSPAVIRRARVSGSKSHSTKKGPWVRKR